MAWKVMVTELLWFLRGDTNIKWLVENKCNIWNGDAYKAYRLKVQDHYEEGGDVADMDQFLEFVKEGGTSEFGDLGPIYGKQWRNWTEYYVEKLNGGNPIIVERTKDQIAVLIDQLKTNPDSRRLMVSAWNVADLDQMVLPPCHYGFQCYVRDGKYLSLMWNQRSVDTFLGLPFNIASYAALLCLIAEEVNMIPDQLIGNLGDVHLYSNHVDQAMEQISREIYDLPTVSFKNVNILDGEFDYEVHDYKYHPSIKAPLSN